jgi:hypothetical protein
MTNPPPVGSAECSIGQSSYNLTTTNTYITMSLFGKTSGPWTPPILVRGMENGAYKQQAKDPYSWSCASGNPSPAFHPNGTLFAAMRMNPCFKGYSTREHIGLWRADQGWDGEWTLVSQEPLFGWGGGSERNCSDANACPSHEDPHLWIDDRGFHLLTHDQNNHTIHQVRGAYGWSVDGHTWVLETSTSGGESAWDMGIIWSNGSASSLARRQRVSLIRNAKTGRPTHVINGADMAVHMKPGPGVCEGCHWGQGFTLVQPLSYKQGARLKEG